MNSIYTIRHWNEHDPFRQEHYSNHGLFNRKPTLEDKEVMTPSICVDFINMDKLSCDMDELLLTGKTGSDKFGFDIIELNVINLDDKS